MFPFPTLQASHPDLSPEKGYWRGPVWLDQAWFAIRGMENNSFEKEAQELMQKLFNHAEGLAVQGKPFYENYNPLTGEGLNARNFSWSAAHILLLLKGG